VSCLFQSKAGPSSAEISGAVAKMYEDLPSEFRAAKAMSGDPKRDRLGFQGESLPPLSVASYPRALYGHPADHAATNIMVTMQTLKMVLAGTEDSSVGQRCGIAGELLDALTTVPTAYIQAINAPTVSRPTCLVSVSADSRTAAPPRWSGPPLGLGHPIPAVPVAVSPSPQCTSRHGRRDRRTRVGTFHGRGHCTSSEGARGEDRQVHGRSGHGEGEGCQGVSQLADRELGWRRCTGTDWQGGGHPTLQLSWASRADRS
jgi:hypothetical protein